MANDGLQPAAQPKRLRRELPPLPRFDRLDRRLPYAATSTTPAVRPLDVPTTTRAAAPSRTHHPATPKVSAPSLAAAKGRRPSHGGHQQPQGHSAGNHHIRQPSPVPSSASSSGGDSEREDDDLPSGPRRHSSSGGGLSQFAAGPSDGARWRAGRRRASRSSRGAGEAAKMAADVSSSAPGGESDAFGGTITEEAWTPAVERLAEDGGGGGGASASSRSGWAWAVVPDFARSSRSSPAQPPAAELPDAATFAQMLSHPGLALDPAGGGSSVGQGSPSSGNISPTISLAQPAGTSTPPAHGASLPGQPRARLPSLQPLGPSASQRGGRLPVGPVATPVFPLTLGLGPWRWKVTRQWTHSALIVVALAGASFEVWKEGEQEDRFCVLEIILVAFVSCAYVFLRPFRLPVRLRPPGILSEASRTRSNSPGPHHHVGPAPAPVEKTWGGLKGFVWGTDDRNYRECPDDGALTGLLFGPLLSASLLLTTLRQRNQPGGMASPLPDGWLVECPLVLPSTAPTGARADLALDALTRSRRSMLSLSTVVTLVLLLQLVLSRRAEIAAIFRPEPAADSPSTSSPRPAKGHHGHGRAGKDAEREKERDRRWVPRSEWRRTVWVVALAFGATVVLGLLKAFFGYWNSPLWRDLSAVDILIASLYHQFSMYVCVRLARKGFTLGELGIVSQFSTALFMEVVNLTRARISLRFLTTTYVQTYRLPSPLLIYQLALMPGSFLVGFLLSPILYLSRYISQKPSHRLRFPEEKNRHRRFLALGFYLGTLLIVGGVVGTWSRWQLDWRDPWVWIVLWVLDGSHWWSRPALLGYWAALASISVAGWELQLAKTRHKRPWATVGPPGRDSVGGGPGGGGAGGGSTASKAVAKSSARSSQAAAPPSTSSAGTRDGGGPSYHHSTVMARVPVLSLNGRRKFFHGLAILMFVPGIYFDPAFSHIAFSVAFAIFVFAEYVRYFALYPFGVMVHLFLNEFIDHKDSGTAILSHFYLLTGCALGLWLESPSPLLSYVGVLTLGIGDALASIVGRQVGRKRWSLSSGKTVEGSVAFVASVVVSVAAMHLLGIVPPVSPWKLGLTALASALLEAVSNQNDNLEIPLYTWTVMSALGM